MAWLELDFQPASGFATPVRGFTLFAQCCAFLGRQDPARLVQLLEGYAEGRPFAVFGDPRPLGHVPRPTIPMHMFAGTRTLNSKAAKGRRWTPVHALSTPVEDWLLHSRSDAELAQLNGLKGAWQVEQVHAVSRHGTAGLQIRRESEFWFATEVPLVIDIVIDEARCQAEEIFALLQSIGWQGYGAGASRGLGKFDIGDSRSPAWVEGLSDSSFVLTLGHCIPLRVDRQRLLNSYYRALIHHGRHAANDDGRSAVADFVKAPVILAQAGALLCTGQTLGGHHCGRGLGAGSRLSLRDPRTVMQGYAPALRVGFTAGAASLKSGRERCEAA